MEVDAGDVIGFLKQRIADLEIEAATWRAIAKGLQQKLEAEDATPTDG